MRWMTRRAVSARPCAAGEHIECKRPGCCVIRGDVLHSERTTGVDPLLAARPLQTTHPFR